MFRNNLVDLQPALALKTMPKPLKISRRRRMKRGLRSLDSSAIKSTWF